MLGYDSLFEWIKGRYRHCQIEVDQEQYKNPLDDDEDMPDIALLPVPDRIRNMEYMGLELYFGKGLILGGMCIQAGNAIADLIPLNARCIDELFGRTVQVLEAPEGTLAEGCHFLPLVARTSLTATKISVEHCEGGRKYW